MEKYRGYIKADVINGIYKIDYCDLGPDDDVMPIATFINSLDDIDGYDHLITFIDHEHQGQYNDLHQEYGIS